MALSNDHSSYMDPEKQAVHKLHSERLPTSGVGAYFAMENKADLYQVTFHVTDAGSSSDAGYSVVVNGTSIKDVVLGTEAAGTTITADLTGNSVAHGDLVTLERYNTDADGQAAAVISYRTQGNAPVVRG